MLDGVVIDDTGLSTRNFKREKIYNYNRPTAAWGAATLPTNDYDRNPGSPVNGLLQLHPPSRMPAEREVWPVDPSLG